MKRSKSTRHSHITGDFGESFVTYLLSLYGFECNRFDHTGIDVIACHPVTRLKMGISVKTRSRYEGTEGGYVGVPLSHFDKVRSACETFGLAPYLAYVVDCPAKMYVLITPMDKALQVSRIGEDRSRWDMNAEALTNYREDPDIMMMEFDIKNERWWRVVSPEDSQEERGKACLDVSDGDIEVKGDLRDEVRKIENEEIRQFFEKELASDRERRIGHPYLIYRRNNRKCWYVGPRKHYAYVWQSARFPNDESDWVELLGDDIDLSIVKDGLTFRVYTREQIEKFHDFCRKREQTE